MWSENLTQPELNNGGGNFRSDSIQAVSWLLLTVPSRFTEKVEQQAVKVRKETGRHFNFAEEEDADKTCAKESTTFKEKPLVGHWNNRGSPLRTTAHPF